ncbi:DNAJ protein JJJ1 homolog [Impatiens glandulifera]|uniref:DNAJ protein JJJ1 homolog n=1 Tax=Impatiens glandulifera TaxID=253017 RepID=UPI001FB0D090|nr:DNAJ protein JJJ1 homolog [Impatiens glandulifera]
MSSSTAEKRCLYEVLGLSRDCAADEIRSAYKRQALRCHPDKLIQSGVSPEVATASFQELVNAYEVLSDPKERSWYDSHRSQILFSNAGSKSAKGSVPDLFSFFTNSVFSGYSDTGKGFFKVYGDVFDKIYSNEINFASRLGLDISTVKKAPLMGNLNSPYEQVTAFYGYWLGFVTVMDFCWEDEYDAMAGVNRKSRRVMEEENKKVRKKARREYNDTVRGLAGFVKKRDKRVIDMQVKKKEEMEKKRVGEMIKKKELERQKMERAMAYKAPKWTEVEEEEIEIEIDLGDDGKNGNAHELYCVACGKRFKSDKQWKNHEQSKKHKEKVAELREAFSNEDGEMDDDDDVEELHEQFDEQIILEEKESDDEVFVGADDGSSDSKGIDDDENEDEDSFLEAMISGHKKSKSAASLEKAEEEEEEGEEGEESGDENEEAQSSEEEMFVDADNGDKIPKSDEEEDFLEAMISGHKKKKNVRKSQAKAYSPDSEGEKAEEETDFMEYNNTKSTRRNRRKDRTSKPFKEDTTVDEVVGKIDTSSKPSKEDTTTVDEVVGKIDTSSKPFKEDITADEVGEKINKELSVEQEREDNNATTEDQPAKKSQKPSKPAVKKKGKAKKESIIPPQPQGRKQKKSTSSVCETCGEDFGSKTKLHKHLNDSGHATLKHR